jgi:hypothetical protein
MDEDNFLNGDIAHVRQSLYREVELVAETTIESLLKVKMNCGANVSRNCYNDKGTADALWTRDLLPRNDAYRGA